MDQDLKLLPKQFIPEMFPNNFIRNVALEVGWDLRVCKYIHKSPYTWVLVSQGQNLGVHIIKISIMSARCQQVASGLCSGKERLKYVPWVPLADRGLGKKGRWVFGTDK